MNLQTRLKKLETAALPAPHDGLCSCPASGKIVVCYPGDETPADMPPVSVCDVCGGESLVVKIEVIYTDEGMAA